jgi:hypothetical protein
MAEALLERFGWHCQNALAQPFSKLLKEIPIGWAMGEERLNILKRLVDKVGEVQVEAQVRASEIIEGIVHLGDSPTIKLCASGRVLSIGNLWSGRFGKEGQDTRAFLGRHAAEKLTIFEGNWFGGGKALRFKVIKHIQLVLDIGQGSPVEAVGTQVVSNARDSFYPV